MPNDSAHSFETQVNIKPFTQALRDIHSAVNLSDRVGSLQLYGAATAIYRDVLQVVNAEPEADRAANHDYIIEKLSYFMQYFTNAVMPVEGDHMTPAERLSLASDNLMKVEIS
jgi:hypothetical protein